MSTVLTINDLKRVISRMPGNITVVIPTSDPDTYIDASEASVERVACHFQGEYILIKNRLEEMLTEDEIENSKHFTALVLK